MEKNLKKENAKSNYFSFSKSTLKCGKNDYSLSDDTLRIFSSNWNDIASSKCNRAINDRELFGIQGFGSQFGIGLALEDSPNCNIRFSNYSIGFYFDAVTYHHGNENNYGWERMFKPDLKYSKTDYNGALWLQHLKSENKVRLFYPNNHPIVFNLPDSFTNMNLIPIAQVWNGCGCKIIDEIPESLQKFQIINETFSPPENNYEFDFETFDGTHDSDGKNNSQDVMTSTSLKVVCKINNWNHINYAKFKSPLQNYQVFGVKGLGGQFGIGLGLPDSKANIRFNNKAIGFYYDAKNYLHGKTEDFGSGFNIPLSNSHFSNSENNYQGGLWLQHIQEKGRVRLFYPYKEPVELNLPEKLVMKVLFPHVQVWNNCSCEIIKKPLFEATINYFDTDTLCSNKNDIGKDVANLCNLKIDSMNHNDINSIRSCLYVRNNEYFGIKAVKNQQYGIGLAIKNTKNNHIRFNEFTVGFYFDSQCYYYNEDKNGWVKNFGGDLITNNNFNICGGMCLQYIKDENKVKLFYPNSTPLIFNLPDIFCGNELVWVAQVWNGNSCKLITDFSKIGGDNFNLENQVED